jgi:hypothetical protein
MMGVANRMQEDWCERVHRVVAAAHLFAKPMLLSDGDNPVDFVIPGGGE